jgi:hypothetical protein
MTQTWAATDLPIEQGRLLFDERSTSDLQVLALEHDFGPRLFVRAEIFNKHMKDPRPRVENFIFPSAVLPELRPDEVVIAPDSSRMQGFDLYATAKFTRNVSAWLSYSRSLANDRINEESVVRSWDQPHSGGIGLAWDRRWWLVSAEVFAHSNWPQTPVAASGPIRTVDEPTESVSNADVGVRNSERRGYYFTVNLKAEVNRSFASGLLHFALEIANATDRINTCCNDLMFFNFLSYYDDTIYETIQNRQESRSGLRVVPYATISFEF